MPQVEYRPTPYPTLFPEVQVRRAPELYEMVNLFFHRLYWLIVNDHFRGPVRVTLDEDNVRLLPQRIARVYSEIFYAREGAIENNQDALAVMLQFASIMRRGDAHQSLFAFGWSLCTLQTVLRELLFLARGISDAHAWYPRIDQQRALQSSINLSLEFWYGRLAVSLRNDMYHAFGDEDYASGIRAIDTRFILPAAARRDQLWKNAFGSMDLG